ncbi:class I adenylate-forming enzyme family protein [Marinihelvus fidelis]|uniref:class I adenylate-forming enzyme family protein n=1 Tax=Marinihelvus fidelis TaxID=2613842 RepID=UPI001CD3A9C1|nr:AMP-binding protein [Marinihelvus fidelis]
MTDLQGFDSPAPLLPEVLAMNARWLPGRPAVIFGEKVLDWPEFFRRTCQVANGLAAMGLERGDRVAVLMSNSDDMVVAMFGAVVGGFVAVPLNTMVADLGLVAMINDAGARVVITSDDHAPRLDAERIQMASVLAEGWFTTGAARDGWRDFAGWRASQDNTDPAVLLRDDDACNIIYSSGTTGQPKGIVHTHRRRLDWFYDLALALRYDRAAVNLCAIGLFSNISWVGMGISLLVGGTVVVMPAFDAAAWLQAVERHGVTHSAMVPLQFQRIVDEPAFADHDLSSIKSLMCCGSPLPPTLKLEVMDRLAPQLIELYGLTEGVITTLEPEQARERPDSVGKPLMGVDLLILDDNDRPCEPGQPGEIVGRCRHLMAGYHERPDASLEARWVDQAGRHWLRTGDIGRIDEQGYLYLVDRKKDLLISGGQNVYPADIEHVMLGHPAVGEVAVVGIPCPRWGETPLALVVANDEPAQAHALRDWTNTRVGKHQRLAGVELIDALPRNANGKVLKRELRDRYRHWLGQADHHEEQT